MTAEITKELGWKTETSEEIPVCPNDNVSSYVTGVSTASLGAGCSGADAELSRMELFFSGALAWKERVERWVQRGQVCCKSTYGRNHVDLFLGHMCPPQYFCSIYRSNLSCIASSPNRSFLS